MGKVISLNKDNFDTYFDKHDFIVMDFSADWCEPCQSFKETVKDMAEHFPAVLFGTIDVSKEQELASAFNVRSVPTTVIIRHQVAVFVQSGMLPKQELHRLLTEAQAITKEQVK